MNLRGWISKTVLFVILILIPCDVMEINKKGIEILKNSEGFSERPYLCPAGVLTVGYGHTGGIKGSVTKDEAEKLLKADVKHVEKAIDQHVKVELTENQFSALVSFIYNIGTGNFAGSTLLKLLNQGKYQEAANQFDKWTFANGKKLEGLVSRRKAEKELFLT